MSSLPADVQQRADAELGAAWRRCEAALPDECNIELYRARGGTRNADTRYAAWAVLDDRSHTLIRQYADTPAAALVALAEALEARNAEV